jgi:hypothetical protein
MLPEEVLNFFHFLNKRFSKHNKIIKFTFLLYEVNILFLTIIKTYFHKDNNISL